MDYSINGNGQLGAHMEKNLTPLIGNHSRKNGALNVKGKTRKLLEDNIGGKSSPSLVGAMKDKRKAEEQLLIQGDLRDMPTKCNAWFCP